MTPPRSGLRGDRQGSAKKATSIHPTHHWVRRKTETIIYVHGTIECARCGVRPWWPRAETVCKGIPLRKGPTAVSWQEAFDEVLHALDTLDTAGDYTLSPDLKMRRE